MSAQEAAEAALRAADFRQLEKNGRRWLRPSALSSHRGDWARVTDAAVVLCMELPFAQVPTALSASPAALEGRFSARQVEQAVAEEMLARAKVLGLNPDDSILIASAVGRRLSAALSPAPQAPQETVQQTVRDAIDDAIWALRNSGKSVALERLQEALAALSAPPAAPEHPLMAHVRKAIEQYDADKVEAGLRHFLALYEAQAAQQRDGEQK